MLANPDLLTYYAPRKDGEILDEPPNPCSWCSQCCTRTAVLPLGCYDVRRFKNDFAEMQRQIMQWSADSSS